MDYQFNGKQSHATRLELFIALNYLLDNCTSEDKPSKTIELQEYAAEKFNGEFVNRRKANDIFDDLVEFTHKYPNIIPYTVIKLNGKPRYYIRKNILAKKDIEKIASAIKDHSALTEKASDQLIERFLDKVTDENKKKEIIDKLHKTPSLARHQTDDEQMIKIEEFEWLRDNQARFFFKLYRKPDISDMSSHRLFRSSYHDGKKRKKIKEFYPGYYAGYVFEVAQTPKSTKLCIYLPDYHGAFITNINNVIMHETYDPIPSEGKINFDLKSDSLKIDEWFISHFQGKSNTFLNHSVQFKFYVGSDNSLLNKYKQKFEEFFKTPMKYVLKEREVEQFSFNGETRTIVVNDAYVEVECCFDAFKTWYWESGAFESVVILKPSNWNDRLLEQVVDRFSRRLTKYGAKYNYSLEKTLKPEYEEMMKERHERISRIKEERNIKPTSQENN